MIALQKCSSGTAPRRGVAAVAAVLTLAAVVAVSSAAASTPSSPSRSGIQERHDRHREHQEHGDRVHEFEDAEAWAERFNDPERDAWQKPGHVVDLLEIEAGMIVADIGTGTGYFLPHLSRAVGESGTVLALDVSDEMIGWVRREMLPDIPADNVVARVVPPDDPGLEEGAVDRVLIVNTWHHVSDRPSYAAGLLRALAPGGSVAVVDFTLESDDGPPVEMRLAPEEVVRELEAGGLRAEIVAEELPKQYVVVARRPAG